MYKVEFKGMPRNRQETDNHEHRTYNGCNDQTSAGAIPDVFRPEMLDVFDRETFEGDAYWVCEGVVTDAGCKQWRANLKKLQHMNSEESSQTCLYCIIGLITCKLV